MPEVAGSAGQSFPAERPGLLQRGLGAAARILVNVSALGSPRGVHVTRWFMYRRIRELRLRAEPGQRVMSVSGSGRLCEVAGLGLAEVTEAAYPDVTLLDLPYADASFDYAVADQVLEHVAGDPQRAVDEIRRVLRPGGVAIITTCFLNPIHWGPEDLWRFTPAALRYLCRDYAEVLQVEGWGNRWLGLVEWLGLRFDGVPERSWHPLRRAAGENDPLRPVVTWIVARR